MDETPILIGAHYSVYTRIVHGALLLKGAPFSFQELDVFAVGGKEKVKELGNPFGKIPILQYGSKSIYETKAILTFLDVNFKGTVLFPCDVEQRIVCEQLISISDQYIYPILVWKLYVPFSNNMQNDIPDEDLTQAKECLDAIDAMLMKPWACGENITVADLYLEANLRLFMKTSFATSILRDFPAVRAIIERYQNEEFFQNIPHKE